MRILFVTQWFEPERTTKGLLFARALRDRGHDVEVLTGIPNYPGGKVFPGYRLRWRPQTEVMDRIRVVRAPLYPSHDRSPVKRIANYLSFAASAALFGNGQFDRSFDVIYAYWPPATIGIPAVILSSRLRAPFVLEIQDMWPDTVAASGMLSSGVTLRAIGAYCRWVYGKAAAISVISEGFRRSLIERGVAAEKIHVIHNWCDDAASRPVSRDVALAPRLGIPLGRFIVLFAGTMGTAQGLGTVLAAARLSANTLPDAHFVFVGGGVERARLEREAAGATNVTFLPMQAADQMPPILALADALLVHLRDEPLFSITIPSKTQSALASGRPIIMAVRGDAATLVQASGGGMTCAPENPDALVSAVRALMELSPAERARMAACAADYYREHLSLDAGVDLFEQIFSSVAQGVRAPRSSVTRRVKLAVKRAIDVVGSAVGLVVFAPVLAAVALGIRVTMGGPVLFVQERPGLNAKPYRLVKFRTMRNATDSAGRPLPDGARLTRFGTWLRRLSLDELPELLNVLRGEMSLVGPRPLLTRYTPFFTGRERLRMTMRPGITGLAQIHGRNEVEWSRRLSLDADYVEQWSLHLDLRILIGTFSAVLTSRGAVPDANTIMLDLDEERGAVRETR